LLWLSELLLQNLELDSFLDLEALIRTKASEGERFYQSDVKPPFPDTPENWDDRLEAAFTTIGEHCFASGNGCSRGVTGDLGRETG
jgi:hypothetical protein|tara:strand:+ start:33771 stop:34028 length:258 start_codon:yes stop_codon:yes gene_type:complete